MARDKFQRDIQRDIQRGIQAKLSYDKAHLKNRVLVKYVLVVDARETDEPTSYVFTVDTAPSKLLCQLARNMDKGKHNYRHVYLNHGPGATDGLVDDEDGEDIDQYMEYMETIQEWIDNNLFPCTEFTAPCAITISFQISLAEC